MTSFLGSVTFVRHGRKYIYKQMFIYKPDIIFMHSFEHLYVSNTHDTVSVYEKKQFVPAVYKYSLNYFMFLLSSLCNVPVAEITRFQ